MCEVDHSARIQPRDIMQLCCYTVTPHSSHCALLRYRRCRCGIPPMLRSTYYKVPIVLESQGKSGKILYLIRVF